MWKTAFKNLEAIWSVLEYFVTNNYLVKQWCLEPSRNFELWINIFFWLPTDAWASSSQFDMILLSTRGFSFTPAWIIWISRNLLEQLFLRHLWGDRGWGRQLFSRKFYSKWFFSKKHIFCRVILQKQNLNMNCLSDFFVLFLCCSVHIYSSK